MRALSGSSLELAQQTLLALAHLRHERARGGLVERDVHTRGLLMSPGGQLPGLHLGLLGDLPGGGLDGLVYARGRLGASLLAGEQRDGGVG